MKNKKDCYRIIYYTHDGGAIIGLSNERSIMYPWDFVNKTLGYLRTGIDPTKMIPLNDSDLVEDYVRTLLDNNIIRSGKYSLDSRPDSNNPNQLDWFLTGWVDPNDLEILDNPFWDDSLIWCPSQCYCNFLDPDTNTIYCIYLRWRHNDPWTSELIRCTPFGDFESSIDGGWEDIETSKLYMEEEYPELKKECEELMLIKFPNLQWIQRIQ